MDNDDFRRGKPTNHKVFGEGIAVLAGDALLTQAFEIAAQAKGWPRYSHRDLILEIAIASGSLQLVAGQVADLEGEGKKLSVNELRYIHERKTSALLCCSVRLGGMSANCTPAQLKALTDFGYNVGLAFQVIDDILDVTQTSEQLGKTAGKDVAVQKATYPAIVGLEKSGAKSPPSSPPLKPSPRSKAVQGPGRGARGTGGIFVETRPVNGSSQARTCYCRFLDRTHLGI